MKTNKFLGIAILAGAMVMVATCKKSEDSDGIKPPTSAVFDKVRADALNDIIQKKTFKAGDGLNFTSKGGVQLWCSICSGSNEDMLELEFVELYKRGDMLVVNKPLMGTSLSGNKGPMITGGQFYVNVKKNGTPVECAYYNMNVPSKNTGKNEIDPNMRLWEGKVNSDGDILWEEGDERKGQEFGVWGEGAEYNVFCGIFGWINIDILSMLQDPKTPVWVKVPDGYNHKNCSVYVVYKDQPGSLAYLDVWDSTKKMFTEHYGLAPIGFNFYVVFVSVQDDGKYVYSCKDEVVARDKVIEFKKGDLKVTGKDALIKIINDLK